MNETMIRRPRFAVMSVYLNLEPLDSNERNDDQESPFRPDVSLFEK